MLFLTLQLAQALQDCFALPPALNAQMLANLYSSSG
jgi:hypothetical protein